MVNDLCIYLGVDNRQVTPYGIVVYLKPQLICVACSIMWRCKRIILRSCQPQPDHTTDYSSHWQQRLTSQGFVSRYCKHRVISIFLSI